MESQPVFILLTAKGCGHCTKLYEIWPSIKSKIEGLPNKITIVEIRQEGTQANINPSIYPKDLETYRKWFPMILLVNGSVWNKAMSNLGVNNDVKLNAAIMNGKMGEKGPEFKSQYGKIDPDSVAKFITETLSSNGWSAADKKLPVSIPTIQPTNKTLINTGNGASVNNTITNNIPTKVNTYIPTGVSNNVCSMKIMSRRNK
jgi:hypothetical protein